MTVQKLKGKLFEAAFGFNLFCVFVAILVVLCYHVKIEDTAISVFMNLINETNPFDFLRGGNFADPEDFANTFTKWLL